MARYDDLNTNAIGYATFVSTVLLLLIILLVRALCYYWVDGESDRKLADAHYVEADQEISAQKAVVSSYEKVTVEVPPPPAPEGEEPASMQPVEEERIRIPVARAKDILIKELAGEASPST